MPRSEILFIYPQGVVETDFRYSLGAGYIQAYLASKGIASLQFKCKQPCSLESLVKEILSLNTPVVGFTCYEVNYPRVVMLANALKKRKKDILVVVGGPSPTFADQIILKDCRAIDICVRGEGEHTVYQLLLAIKEGRDLAGVKGISYRSNGRLVRTPLPELITSGVRGAELDEIPSPYLSGLIPPEEGLGNFGTGIITGRGCPYKCIYCSFSIMGRQKVRLHSPERVVEELKLLWKAAQRRKNLLPGFTLYIYDDTFTIYPGRTKEICQRILKAGLRGMDIWAETRADRLDRETMDLLFRAGVKRIDIGLESAVPYLLNRMQKVRPGQRGEEDNYAPEKELIAKLRETVVYGKKIGMKIGINILQGLPGESYQDVRKTVNFVKSLGVIDEVNQNQLYVYPGTELFVNSGKYGIKLKKARKGSLHFTIENPSPGMHYPMEFPGGQKQQFIFWMFPGVFSIFSHAPLPAADGLLKEIVIVNSARFPRNLLSWLDREADIETAVSFLGGFFSENDIEQNYASLLEHGFLSSVPIQYFIEHSSAVKSRTLTLRREPLGFSWRWVEASARAPKFHFLPLDSYRRAATLISPKPGQHDYIIFTVKSEKDIKTLTGITRTLDNSGKFVIPKSLNRFVPSLENECRWSDMLCPAFRLSKAIVDGKGRIYPCLQAKLIGKVGQSLGKIRLRLNSLMKKEMALRGCVRCPLKEQCSKCLFPYPMNREGYCRIRRGHPNIHKVASMMKIPRAVLWNSQREFSPRRLVFISGKISPSKKGNIARRGQAACSLELLSLRQALEKVRKRKDDILPFQWGDNHYIGLRSRAYYSYWPEVSEIYRVNSQVTQILSELLLGRSAEEALLCLERNCRLNKQGRKQVEQLLKFVADAFTRIQV